MGRSVQQLELSVGRKDRNIFTLPASDRHRSRRFDLWHRITSQLPNVTLLRIRHCNLSGFLRELSDTPEFPTIQDALSSIYNLPRLRAIELHTSYIGNANQLLQLIGAFPHLAALRMSNVHNAGPPQSFDLAPIRDFMERHQQGTIRFQELLVHNGDWLGEQMPTLLSVLSESPFEMRLKRLGWTTISRAGRSTNWEVLCPQMERIFRLSQPRLEYLHLGVDTDDGELPNTFD